MVGYTIHCAPVIEMLFMARFLGRIECLALRCMISEKEAIQEDDDKIDHFHAYDIYIPEL